MEESPKARSVQRQRRQNIAGGRVGARHDVKVSAEEEGILARLAAAQGVSIVRLLVESALSSESHETPTQRRELLAELFRVHRLLAAISNNVNQIAKATNATGELQAETVETLRAVRRTAEQIDAAVDGLSLR
ncbi:hypothetical protein GCM10009749_35040 [Agromyces neolithicus]|uniref:Bacterial mobilisation domain-containing protein n=2 Tax=Agromyces neolithicus TaxID=269420 RepID=A0ABN2MEC7_9MICO